MSRKIKSDVELRGINTQRDRKILEILKEDARRELSVDDQIVLPHRKKILELLLKQTDLIHVDFWGPSQKVLDRLMGLGLIEDRFVESDKMAFENHHLRPVLEDAKEKISRGLIPTVLGVLDNNTSQKLYEELVPKSKEHDHCFIRQGGVWFVKFKGEFTYIKHLKRLQYITLLLIHQGESLGVLDIIRGVNGEEVTQKMDKFRLEEEGLSRSDLDSNDLSRDDKEQLKTILYDEWSKSQNTHGTTAKESWNEVKEKTELAYPFINIREKEGNLVIKFNNQIDKKNVNKARNTVCNSMKKSLKKDIRVQIPGLYEHLERYISYGKTCKYDPGENSGIRWYIES